MSRKRKLTLRVALVLVAAAGAAIAVNGYLHFTRWGPPPEGRVAFTSRSPHGTWEVTVQELPYGGAAGGVEIRADILRLSDGQTRELYYDEPEEFDYKVHWPSENEVLVAGRRLNAVDGRYDFRYDGSSWVQAGIVAGFTAAVVALGLLGVWLLAKLLDREPSSSAGVGSRGRATPPA